MKIRSATPSDLDAIVEVFRACWSISYKDLLPLKVQQDMTLDVARHMWSAAVQPHADRSTLLTEFDDKVVGIARIGIDPDNANLGHLFSLYVHPDSSGKGFGRKLLLEAMRHIGQKGFTSQSLWVFKDNRTAKNLYLSEGFILTGEERIDPRWQIPETKMVLNAKP